MGQASGKVLALDTQWEGRCPITFMAPLPDVDAAAMVLRHCDGPTLAALAATCKDAAESGRQIREIWTDDQLWRNSCEQNGWSFDTLSNVDIYVSGARRAIAPAWLAKWLQAARPDGSGRPRALVVDKVLDALGPLAHTSEDPTFEQRPTWRRLFQAHVRHQIGAGEPYISAQDARSLRKLRGLQAYLYAEGFGQGTLARISGGSWEALALQGRIEVM